MSLVFISFLMYICGIHLIYELKLEAVKEKNHIEGNYAERQHELIDLQIPLSEITWVKDHEFRWKGEMYDIAEKRIEGELLICTVYHDKEEKELNENYSAQQKSSEGSDRSQHHTKTIQPFLNESDHNLYNIVSGQLIQPGNCIVYNHIYTGLFSPPPEV